MTMHSVNSEVHQNWYQFLSGFNTVILKSAPHFYCLDFFFSFWAIHYTNYIRLCSGILFTGGCSDQAVLKIFRLRINYGGRWCQMIITAHATCKRPSDAVMHIWGFKILYWTFTVKNFKCNCPVLDYKSSLMFIMCKNVT